MKRINVICVRPSEQTEGGYHVVLDKDMKLVEWLHDFHDIEDKDLHNESYKFEIKKMTQKELDGLTEFDGF